MILLPLFTVYFRPGSPGTLWPLIITYTAIGLPLTVFMMATYFRAVPREVFEAATLDGASIFRLSAPSASRWCATRSSRSRSCSSSSSGTTCSSRCTFTTSDDLRTIQVGLLDLHGRSSASRYGRCSRRSASTSSARWSSTSSSTSDHEGPHGRFGQGVTVAAVTACAQSTGRTRSASARQPRVSAGTADEPQRAYEIERTR